MLLAGVLSCAPVSWAADSVLSRWIGREAVPELAAMLASHPRLEGERVRLVTVNGNGLDSEIAEALLGGLGGDGQVSLQAGSLLPDTVPDSIDELDCGKSPHPHVELRVSAVADGAAKARVEIALADPDDAPTTWRRWLWQGRLSGDERESLGESVAPAFAEGSLRSPWSGDAVDRAAAALSMQLACNLRAQVVSKVAVHWTQPAVMPGQQQDIFNASRHLLGSMREIALAPQGDIDIAVKAEPFSDDLLQLWLTGTPRGEGFEPVQAVTYIRRAHPIVAAVPQPSAAPASASPSPVPVLPAAPAVSVVPRPAGHALAFLDVDLVDVSQAERSSRADLHVRLQLANRAQWPIAYRFQLSGGHYLHCVPEKNLYRHDRYGFIEGEIPAGGRLQREFSINGVQHKPNPWMGPRKCAGFKSLAGFENFSDNGYKVTKYVRWSM